MISKEKIENFNKKFDVVGAFIEHQGKILLLHRQSHKPQGGTWGVVGGKVHDGEDKREALAREIQEETDICVKQDNLRFLGAFYVRYPDFDFMYHIYHLELKEKPVPRLNPEEHAEYKWLRPEDALALNLIQDEDSCIKWFFNLG